MVDCEGRGRLGHGTPALERSGISAVPYAGIKEKRNSGRRPGRNSDGRSSPEVLSAADRPEDPPLAPDLHRGATEVFAGKLGDDACAFPTRVGHRLAGFDETDRGDSAGAEGAVGVERDVEDRRGAEHPFGGEVV